MSKKELALFGGPKTIEREINFSVPVVPEKAYKTINELLAKGAISSAPVVFEFEKRFASYIGVRHGLCMVNGTTSIQAALFACGVKAGDEVIVPTFTFWATVGPVVACGGVPVFADVGLDSHNLTAETIGKKITPRTKAILLVHVWGTPCDIDPIMAVAKKHGLRVIEDCSHAHGGTYKGRKLGSIGDAGCFSMQGSKVLPAGEGGIMVTNDTEIYQRAMALGHYERLGNLEDDSPYKKYRITGFGFKHRVHPLAIAIADANLDCLDEFNEKRSGQGKYLEKCISDISFIKPQTVPEGSERVFAYHYARLVAEKAGGISVLTVLKALAAEGIICGSCGYGRLHEQPLYAGSGPYGEGGPFYSKALNISYKPTASDEVQNSVLLADTAFMIAPRFEIDCKKEVELYAEAYHKIADNIEKLIDYDRKTEAASKRIENKGTSINYFK